MDPLLSASALLRSFARHQNKAQIEQLKIIICMAQLVSGSAGWWRKGNMGNVLEQALNARVRNNQTELFHCSSQLIYTNFSLTMRTANKPPGMLCFC